jgi:hypothetical protein
MVAGTAPAALTNATRAAGTPEVVPDAVPDAVLPLEVPPLDFDDVQAVRLAAQSARATPTTGNERRLEIFMMLP